MNKTLLTLLAAAFTTTPVFAQSDVRQHQELWRAVERAGVTLYVNNAQYCDPDVTGTRAFGWYNGITKQMVICQEFALNTSQFDQQFTWSEEDFDTVMEVNMKSIFNLTKAVLRPMLKQRSGSIINMSSVVGVKGNAGQANYSASKAGIIGFSKSTALELGSRNIRCNVIAPGFIETEMTAKLDENIVKGWTDSIPLKRGGTPEDIANATVFLASDMSAYISGQVLNVCGGMLT